MENTGAVNLNFCTAEDEEDACDLAHSIEVTPGAVQTRTIEELGGAQKSNLNVTNSNPDNAGSCKVSFPLNWKRLALDQDEVNKWRSLRSEWIPLYEKYSDKRTKRTSEIKDELRDVQKRFITFAQPLLNRFDGLRSTSIKDLEEFHIRAAQLKDVEPSPVHGSHIGTGAPVVSLKNMGGAMIDVKCRRISDKNLPSMLKGFMLELRWLAGPPPPTDPDAVGLKEELSSKVHFQVVAGMTNLGKTFFCYVRWRHKTNPAILSPWTNLMQVIIA